MFTIFGQNTEMGLSGPLFQIEKHKMQLKTEKNFFLITFIIYRDF